MASRLSEILQNEYKTKGVFSGAASAFGKRTREKLDIRNALFGGSGLGSILGRKVFGKGYSATGKDSKISSSSEGLGAGASTILQEISINSKVTAKNSLAMPSMARDMFLMKQNMVKLVKLQGGTPTTKAGDWFSRQAARESAYESQFGKKSSANTPTKMEEKKSSGGFFGLLKTLVSGISSAITTLGGVISSAVSGLGRVLASAIDALAIALLGRKILPGILPGGGAGGRKGKVPGRAGGGKGRLGGLLSILGLGYVAQDMFGGGGDQPESAPGSPTETPGATPQAENKTNWSSIASSSVEAGIGAVGAVSTISGVASRSKVQGYNSKAKQFVDAGGKFVKAKELPKGEMLKKFFDFTAKASSKGWMGKLASKLALRLGTSVALKAMTFFGGLAVPGAGWFVSAIALASLAVDAYLIYDAIFASGGILDELEKEDSASTNSPTLQTGTQTASPAAPNSPQTANSPTAANGSQGNIPLPKGQTISSNEAIDYLVKKGMSPAQAAGVVGNLLQESKLNSGAQNKAEGAYGFAQWRGSRLTDLQNFAASRGKSIDDANTQLDFIMHELNGKEKKAGQMLLASNTAEEAAYNFGKYYERPKTVEQSRMNWAAQTLAQYKPTGGGGSSNVQLAQVGDGMGSSLGAEIMSASNDVNDARNTPTKSQPVQVAQDNRQTVVNNSGGGGGGTQMTAYDQYFGKYLINRTT
jgi:hypothetical protein